MPKLALICGTIKYSGHWVLDFSPLTIWGLKTKSKHTKHTSLELCINKLIMFTVKNY